MQSGKGRKVARGIIALELGLGLRGWIGEKNAGDFTGTTGIRSLSIIIYHTSLFTNMYNMTQTLTDILHKSLFGTEKSARASSAFQNHWVVK